MREEDFREWLEANGANSPDARDTRVYAVKTIEARLEKLGFDYPNLEAAWEANRFEDLRLRLSEILSDYDRGGDLYRILMPQSEKPRARLSSWRSWLKQYGRFLSGEASEGSDAELIRQYVLEEHIEPARRRDEDAAEIVVKEVNDALKLNQAWPNICQAMRGRKFQEIADVPPPQSFGADQSTATRFRFDLDRDRYWALRILRQRYGEPLKNSKKMAAFQLGDGRQIAIDLEAARTQLWLEGEVAKSPGVSVTPYAANAPRHSNLPERLRHKGEAARAVSLVTVENADGLEGLLTTYDGNSGWIDREALEALKKRFLEKFPDFVDGGGFVGRSSYHPEEDDYKRALIERAQELLESTNDNEELGSALLDLVAGKGGLKSNLLGRWMPEALNQRRFAHPGLLERAAGDMVRNEDPLQGIIDFIEKTWERAFADPRNNPHGDSRTLPTMVAALVHPERVVAIWTNRFNNLFWALHGEKLFGGTPLTASELKRATRTAAQLLAIMRDEWGWKPRDLWDVQGFIWVTCRKKLVAGETREMTDDELLARFDGSEHFRTARTRWTEIQKRAFCTMARAVHDIGLDWYHTEIPEVRFGRKALSASVASGTIGTVRARRPAIAFTHQSGTFDLSGDFACDEAGADAFVSALEGASSALSQWQEPQTERAGHWPDEYGSSTQMTENTTPEPQNVILYGPPGTGKTYRTAAEAVRLCEGTVSSDRAVIKERYQALWKVGRIRFVTFHQSYSYEEFVEGLRPEIADAEGDTSAGTAFTLEPRDGIFKELCAVAEEAQSRHTSSTPSLDLAGRKFWKMSLGHIGSDDDVYEQAIEDKHIALGWGGNVDWSDARFGTQDAIRNEWLSAPRDDDRPSHVNQLHPFRNTMKVGDIVIVPYGNKAFRAVGEVTGDYYFEASDEPIYRHRRKVRWLLVLQDPLPLSTIIDGDFQMRSFYSIASSRVNKEALARLIGGGEEQHGPDEKGETQQFVLIIDEINRANVSKVFGELITLIEPDKRVGMRNEIKVQLPYSKKPFGVPANLHIIGTMNTADRSIALLDTALRRRFRFKEMAPDTSVDAFREAERRTGVPLSGVLTTMNRRIEYLVDRDHRIGHAFFIGCEEQSDVDRVMRDKVIPLLQEYFFEDWNRLAAVLGEKERGGNFLDCDTIEDPMGQGRASMKTWRVKESFQPDAYQRLAAGTPPNDVDEIDATEPE